LTIILSFL